MFGARRGVGASKLTHGRVWGKGEGVGNWPAKEFLVVKGRRDGVEKKGVHCTRYVEVQKELNFSLMPPVSSRPKKDRLDGLKGVEVLYEIVDNRTVKSAPVLANHTYVHYTHIRIY
jgi:hypothetical protein